MEINTLLKKAKSLEKKGSIDEAIQIYQSILESFPKSQEAIKRLKKLKFEILQNSSDEQKQNEIDFIIELYSEGQIQEALDASEILIKDYPNEPILHNISGTCYKELQQSQEAVKSYEKALEINPNYAEVYCNLGVTLNDLGQQTAAINNFEKAIAIEPNYAEAHYNIGNTLRNLRQLNEAVKHYKRALVIKPSYVEAHYNLGISFKSLGQPSKTIEHFEKALKIKPDYPEVIYNLANTLRDLKQLDAAIKLFEKVLVIKPNYAEAHCNLGNILTDLGQFNVAIMHYKQALKIKPNYVEAHSNLGVALSDLGLLDTAVVHYEQALAIKPDYVEAHSNLGIALKALGQLDVAIKHYRQALAIKPDHVETHSNLGVALSDLGQLEAAVKHYEQALAIKPDFLEAYSNLGITLNNLGKYDAAVTQFEKALMIDPDYAEAHYNLGNTFSDLKQLDEAIKHFKKAISINPQYAEAKWNLSLAQLITGQFREGWENYESRWKIKDSIQERQYSQPLWDGSLLVHKTLFLYPEQGIGDIIIFIRYVKVLSTKTTKIIVECPKSLHRLFSTIREINVLVTKEDPLPYFDFFAPLLSLPKILNTSLKNIPIYIPYLFANNHIVSPIINDSKILKIGLVWAGNPAQKDDKKRSIDFSCFSAVTQIPNTKFYSLQVGERRGDLSQYNFSNNIIDLSQSINDYADTAAIIKQLDLIITVCTSVAHLAGAMGKPVWVLLSSSAYWLWLLERNDSPWYPTMRLFRQQQRDNWNTVFDEVHQALEHTCSTPLKSDITSYGKRN
jgi:tetratricopeptide (TPR) repeat protein